jgi:hypothetical protein
MSRLGLNLFDFDLWKEGQFPQCLETLIPLGDDIHVKVGLNLIFGW